MSEFGVNDANAAKIWSKFMAKSEKDSLDISPLMGTDERAIIHVKEETEKGAGDQVKFNLRARLQGDGISESETAEGSGEALTFYQDAIYINELGHVAWTKSEHTIDAQRVPFELRAECKNGLTDWWVDRKSVSFFNQVCGNLTTPNLSPKYTGNNAVTAPAGTSDLVRIVRPSTHTDDQSITSNDVFTTALLDRAVSAAAVGTQAVREVMVGGKKKRVAYISEGHKNSLRSSTGSGSWTDITNFAFSGVDRASNPFYNGAVGEFNNTILRVSQDVRPGVHGSTGAVETDVRRAVLLGAQAAACAYGRKGDYKDKKYRWNEELLDHKRKLEVSAWQIWGLKKTVFNSVDYGVVVMSAYALN